MPYLGVPSVVHVHWINLPDPQKLVPDGDVVKGSWLDLVYGDSDTNLWDELDEIPQDGLTTAIHHFDPHNSIDPLRVTLTDGIDPASSEGHVLKFTASGVPGSKLKAVLYQGASIIAQSPYHLMTPTMQTFTYTLSASEADDITDYTDLEVRILPNGVLTHSTDSVLT